MAHPAPRIVGICGAAIAGPTLALQLLSHPILRTLFRPVLFDQSPPPAPVRTASKESTAKPSPAYSPSPANSNHRQRAGASVALLPNGLYPLFNLGLVQALRRHGHECDDLTLWSGPSSLDHVPDAPLTHLKTMVNGMWSHDMQMGAMYFERASLQSLLVDRVRELGGEVRWSKKAIRFEPLSSSASAGTSSANHRGQTRVTFADGTHFDVDLLVGADGGYSPVRRHILAQRDPKTAEQRWLPHSMGMTGIYGISSADRIPPTHAPERPFSESHSVWLPRGFLATGPCPGRMFRWDLILPESAPPSPWSAPDEAEPRPGASHASPPGAAGKGAEEAWQAAIVPGPYPKPTTVRILRSHLRLRHPFAGDFATMLATADRIIHTPLRQRVWKEDEIQCTSASGGANVVLLGDAARLMLPTSGQGTGFAIEDATVLAGMLLKHAGPSSASSAPSAQNVTGDEGLGAAVEEYARLRRPRSERMAAAASWVGSVGVGSTWYYRLLRYCATKLTPGADLKTKKTRDPWPMNGRFDVEQRER
ncbi:hypothetical protein EsH8_II_001384 [Colletotrichum jinshuiense]